MEEYGQSFGGPGGVRRLEIMSGRGFSSANQGAHTFPAPSADLPPSHQFQMQVRRPSQVASSSSKPWGFSDPEMKRRKRIAKYKVYSIEGRFKASIRNGLRWIKNKCSEIIHGY